MTDITPLSRLDSFEAMLASVKAQYRDATEKIKKLKAEGKEKTATYRQLLGNKLQLGSMLTMYRVYGLTDDLEEQK